jgi:hypothetical protein
MIVTVLWEDARSQGDVRGFSAGDLVDACIRDRRTDAPRDLRIRHVPKNGDSKVIGALRDDYAHLTGNGPVFAVLDRDKIRARWRHDAKPPANCMQGISQRIALECGGRRDIVFFRQNMESLLEACCTALGIAYPDRSRKPRPDERDAIIGRVVRDRNARAAVLKEYLDLRRLVDRVDAALQSAAARP